LGDENIYQMITKYLWNVNCNVTVNKFKAYIEQEIFLSIRIKRKKTISDNTAYHMGWFKKLDFFYIKIILLNKYKLPVM
jgi:hypothetical protein